MHIAGTYGRRNKQRGKTPLNPPGGTRGGDCTPVWIQKEGSRLGANYALSSEAGVVDDFARNP